MLRHAGGRNGLATPAIYFNATPADLPPPPWDIAFQVEANEFRGETSLQVQIQAVRTAETVSP